MMKQQPQEPRMPGLEAPHGRNKPDGMMDPAGEAGWFLQREREDRGLSLEQAGDLVGIHPYHLEAIEHGDMTRMPSRAEALEMIAAYADFLGFEPEPLLHHYLSFLPPPELAPRHHPASPAPLSSAKVLKFGKFVKLPPLPFRLPSMPNISNITGGNGGIVASVVAAFVLFSGAAWFLVPGEQPQTDAQQVAQVDAAPQTEAADPMPTASTGAESADVKITETPMEDTATVDAASGADQASAQGDAAMQPGLDPDVMGAFIQKNVTGADATAQGAQAGGQAAEQPAMQTASAGTDGRVFGAPDENVRVVLKAKRAIWLLIEDAKGNRVATQSLNKGDVYRVPNRPGLVATVQDGGAISYLIDGVEKGLLGKPGAVLAAEPLDVKKLEDRG